MQSLLLLRKGSHNKAGIKHQRGEYLGQIVSRRALKGDTLAFKVVTARPSDFLPRVTCQRELSVSA